MDDSQLGGVKIIQLDAVRRFDSAHEIVGAAAVDAFAGPIAVRAVVAHNICVHTIWVSRHGDEELVR